MRNNFLIVSMEKEESGQEDSTDWACEALGGLGDLLETNGMVRLT